MASPTQWTCVCTNSGRWWRTGKPGVLQSTGSQKVGHNWETEQQQQIQYRERACFFLVLFFFLPSLWKSGMIEDFYLDTPFPRHCWIKKEPWSWVSQEKVIWRIRTLKWNVSMEVFSLCVDFPSCELPLYCRTTDLERVSRGCVEMACCLRQAQTTRRVWTNLFRKGSISLYCS